MAKAPLTVDDLQLPTGTAKHAKLLARYVAQQGAQALPALEQCLSEGSAKMRTAAWGLLAGLDVSRAERLALSSAAQAQEATNKKERKALLEGLSRVATPACLRALAEQGALELSELAPEAWERAAPWLPEGLAAARANGSERAWLSTVVACGLQQPAPAVLEQARALLDDPALDADGRRELVERLIRLQDLPTCRRRDLTPGQLERAAFTLPPDECYERLAPRVLEDPVFLYELLSPLRQQAHPDPRWVSLALSLPTEELRVSALTHLRCKEAAGPLLAEAEQLPWGQRLKEVLHALGEHGEPRAAPVLMRWLRAPEGREAAPLLLTSLRSCGRPEDVAALRTLAQADAENRAFYVATAAVLEERA